MPAPQVLTELPLQWAMNQEKTFVTSHMDESPFIKKIVMGEEMAEEEERTLTSKLGLTLNLFSEFSGYRPKDLKMVVLISPVS